MPQPAVYILSNTYNRVLYIGVTNNLVRRIYEHKKEFVGGFTKRYNITKLVYFELLSGMENAIQREKQLKNLVRRKKIALITKINPMWKDLYDEIL